MTLIVLVNLRAAYPFRQKWREQHMLDWLTVISFTLFLAPLQINVAFAFRPSLPSTVLQFIFYWLVNRAIATQTFQYRTARFCSHLRSIALIVVLRPLSLKACSGTFEATFLASLSRLHLVALAGLKVPDWMAPPAPAGATLAKRQAGSNDGEKDPKAARSSEEAKAEVVQAARAGDGKKVQTLLLKIACDHDNLLRDLVGAVYRCFLLDADDPTPIAMKAATVAWDLDCRAKKENGEKPSAPPYLSAFAALMQSLLAREEVPQDAKLTLMHFWEQVMLTTPPEQLADYIRHCRLKELKDFSSSSQGSAPKKEKARRVRIQFFVMAWAPPTLQTAYVGAGFPTTCTPLDLDQALLKALMGGKGAERRMGCPPRGALAREAQKLLDSNRR